VSSIANIIRDGKGKAGHSGAWEVTELNSDHNCSPYEKWPVYQLTHYGHPMLKWMVTHRGEVDILDYDTGHGSVSDQGGMNTAFRVLGYYNLYYSRKGGAQIITRNW
jgi:hypothetical protein